MNMDKKTDLVLQPINRKIFTLVNGQMMLRKVLGFSFIDFLIWISKKFILEILKITIFKVKDY